MVANENAEFEFPSEDHLRQQAKRIRFQVQSWAEYLSANPTTWNTIDAESGFRRRSVVRAGETVHYVLPASRASDTDVVIGAATAFTEVSNDQSDPETAEEDEEGEQREDPTDMMEL